jgi:hypothetical protein
MRNFLFCLIISIFVCQTNVTAQDSQTDNLRRSSFHFSFLIPPLSTNGTYFFSTVNDISLNLFIGASAGTNGFEAGSFININKFYMKGLQMAGFMNIAGIKKAGSSQLSEGVQLAGFANINNNQSNLLSFAGFMNIFTSGFKGAAFAGFANIAVHSELSTQAAGFMNITSKGTTNLEIAGFLNVTENVAGAQIAGFANIAKNVKGTQIAGFLNICDSIEGVPIGFINIVKKNGYRKAEFSINENSFIQFSFKLGVKKFYTIFLI